MFNTYDNRIYALGQGPSQTTITASPKTSVEGSSVLLEGYIADNSPGLSEFTIKARFPQGVPAVSDDSQSEWMTYFYDQLPKPTDATGVEVTLSVIDSNGNYREIGTTTTDTTGFYNYQWTPDITGKYTVIAQFKGTNSYYPSYAESAFIVDPAKTTPVPTQQITPSSAADTYLLPGIIAIILAIAIIGALILIAIRKRP